MKEETPTKSFVKSFFNLLKEIFNGPANTKWESINLDSDGQDHNVLTRIQQIEKEYKNDLKKLNTLAIDSSMLTVASSFFGGGKSNHADLLPMTRELEELKRISQLKEATKDLAENHPWKKKIAQEELAFYKEYGHKSDLARVQGALGQLGDYLEKSSTKQRQEALTAGSLKPNPTPQGSPPIGASQRR